jgi:hypothetical protein
MEPMANTTTKQPEHSAKMIEAALVSLERERGKFLDRQAEHANKKCALAFDAHAGDAEASTLLDEQQREAAEVQSQINSITDAIAEGQRRLAVARAREQREQNAIKAAALRKVLGRFTAAGRELDEAVSKVVRSSHELQSALRDLHAGGINHPRMELIDVFGYRALATGLRETIWSPRFEPLNHADRRNFGDLVTSWSAQIEGVIAAQLGERTDKAA